MDYLEIIRHRRQQNIDLANKKKDAFIKAHPEYKKIEDDIALEHLKTALYIIEHSCQHAESKKLQNLIKKKQELLKQYKIEEKDFAPDYHCKECNDTGYIEGKPCRCLKQLIAQNQKKDYNLYKRLEKENFDTFDLHLFSNEKNVNSSENNHAQSPRELMAENKERAQKFVDTFPNEHSLIFYGGTGSGKTFLCNCIAKEILDLGYSVTYHSAVSLFHLLRNNLSFTATDEIKILYEQLKTTDLLIIDDLSMPPSDFLNAEFFEILNNRIVNDKSIIITTNLSPNEMQEYYEERINSRLFDFVVMKFYGDDIRMKI